MDRQGQKQLIYDTLEAERKKYDLGQPTRASPSLAAKEAMQQLYKNQLDAIVYEKQKQRELDRFKSEQDKRQFNEKAEQGKQAEKMKEISYKNYYHMLMNNQSQNAETYISPFSKRDNLKDNLIQHNIEEQRRRYQQYDIEARKKEQQRKNSYKNDLMQQIQERRHKQLLSRNNEVAQKQYFQKNSKVPEEIRRYEKEKKREQIQKYKQDLQRGRQGRQFRSQSHQETGLGRSNGQSHNILTNPLPFNIQNPYILKQMGVLKNQSSYLAMKGSQNLKIS